MVGEQGPHHLLYRLLRFFGCVCLMLSSHSLPALQHCAMHCSSLSSLRTRRSIEAAMVRSMRSIVSDCAISCCCSWACIMSCSCDRAHSVVPSIWKSVSNVLGGGCVSSGMPVCISNVFAIWGASGKGAGCTRNCCQ